MKREVIVSMAITEEEMKELTLRLRLKEDELGKRITTSAFLRECLLKEYLNGNGSPPQETPIEEPPKITFSEPKPGPDPSAFDFDDIEF